MKYAARATALLFVLMTTLTVGAVDFFNSSDAKIGNLNSVKCASGLSCAKTDGKLVITPVSLSATGDIVGDGGDQLYGFRQEQIASTSVAITVAQCGATFVSNSADVMVLPEASTALGCRLTFVCGTADDFDVNPADGTDVIGITGALAPSAGDAIRCTDIGAGFQLEAVGANLWAVLKTNGTITDVD